MVSDGRVGSVAAGPVWTRYPFPGSPRTVTFDRSIPPCSSKSGKISHEQDHGEFSSSRVIRSVQELDRACRLTSKPGPTGRRGLCHVVWSGCCVKTWPFLSLRAFSCVRGVSTSRGPHAKTKALLFHLTPYGKIRPRRTRRTICHLIWINFRGQHPVLQECLGNWSFQPDGKRGLGFFGFW